MDFAQEPRPQDAHVSGQDAAGRLQPDSAVVDALGPGDECAQVRQIAGIDEMEGLGQYIGHIIDSTGMSAVERGQGGV